MAIKFTIQGVLIYAAMGAYLLAALSNFCRHKKTSWGFFFIGFLAAAGAVAWRSLQAGHVPLSNLFEVMLFLGMIVFALSLLEKWLLGIGGEICDMLMGAAFLFPAGFIFSEQAQPLNPALQSAFFIPHVLAYMLAYAILIKSGLMSAVLLVQSGQRTASASELGCSILICMGFPLLTAGLVLGACWGKAAWGDWWNWDPKELWSLATWATYLFYLHLRGIFPERFARTKAAISLAGFALILITLFWANLSKLFAGLHSYA